MEEVVQPKPIQITEDQLMQLLELWSAITELADMATAAQHEIARVPTQVFKLLERRFAEIFEDL